MALVSALLVVAAQAVPATLIPELRPLAFVAGSCWRGTFAGSTQTDTHCFTPIYGGAFLRDVHIVEGAPAPYAGETIFRWDAALGRIEYDYYASDGAHSSGGALPAANGMVFPEEARRAPDGSEMEIRSSWTRDGDDAYVVLAERRTGETWQRLWEMRMARVGPAAAD